MKCKQCGQALTLSHNTSNGIDQWVHDGPYGLPYYHLPEPDQPICGTCHRPIVNWTPAGNIRGDSVWVHDDGELDMWCKVRVKPKEPEIPIHQITKEEALQMGNEVSLPRMEFEYNLFYTPGRIVEPEVPEMRTLQYTREYVEELMYRGVLTPAVVALMPYGFELQSVDVKSTP